MMVALAAAHGVFAAEAPVVSPGPSWISISSAVATNGSLLLVNVRPELGIAKDAAKVVAEWGDSVLPFYVLDAESKEYQIALGVSYQWKPGPADVKVRILNAKGEVLASTVVRFSVAEGDYRSEILRVDGRHVNPKKKDLERIKREQAEVGRIYRNSIEKKYWHGPFVLPIASPLTSTYGTKRVFNGEMQSFHSGVDLRASVGTQVRSANNGVVVLAKDLFFTGQTVLVDHGYGIFTLYAHMSKLLVKKGEEVKNGQLLGYSGSTGRVSGPHLHWGAIVHNSKIDPTELTRHLR